MGGSFKIGRIAGIDLRLHVTFLLVLPFIAFAFSRVFVNFRDAASGAGVSPADIRGSPLFWGAVIALALFLSVLIHELAHALVAIRKGGKVRDITLLMIGGVSRISEPVKKPGHEVLMAVAGPLTSMALAALFFGGHLLLGPTSWYSLRFALFYLAGLNLVLGIFNLIPAFPMDGGRILRGALTPRMGALRATQLAATLGKAIAMAFVVLAFLSFNFFLLMIALFVYIGADAEASQAMAESVLGEVRVRELVRPAPVVLHPDVSVEDVGMRMSRDRQTALLLSDGEQVTGVVVLDDVLRVPPQRRPELRASQIARPAPAVTPSDRVWDALRVMSEHKLPIIPVVEGIQLLGVLDNEDVMRSLRLRQLERGREQLPLAPGREREQPG